MFWPIGFHLHSYETIIGNAKYDMDGWRQDRVESGVLSFLSLERHRRFLTRAHIDVI